MRTIGCLLTSCDGLDAGEEKGWTTRAVDEWAAGGKEAAEVAVVVAAAVVAGFRSG